MELSAKKRFIKALNREIPDRLPVTTHHVLPSFLHRIMQGISVQEFFDLFHLDPILWITALKPEESNSFFISSSNKMFLDKIVILCSDEWRIEKETISHPGYEIVRFHMVTPVKTLTMGLQSDHMTTWIIERLIKEKSDIDVFERFAPNPVCDVGEVIKQAEWFGERGMVRGAIPGFDIYGQPGCWQDASTLFGTEKLIMETFDDPQWVHTFLGILRNRKCLTIQSMMGAPLDLVELGGGDGSTTVISPEVFDRFVVPYDAELIRNAHAIGLRVVYHLCGGMMPVLERIAGMEPDAVETFTPPSMGGDTDLEEAKKRIGDKVCMIGGFDQFHYLLNCSPEETRRAVRTCFEKAGKGGGYILSPSDHFFDADRECLLAFSDEAHRCIY